jgi:hypothetical protein
MKAKEATLVVIEYGASWPVWMKPSQTSNLAVVAQHYPGEPSSLLTQVASRVTRVEAMGWKLVRVVVVSNGDTTRDSTAARSVLVRGLLARIAGATGAELVLSANDPVPARASRELFALGAALEGAARRTGVTLSARIGRAATPLCGAEPRALLAAS